MSYLKNELSRKSKYWIGKHRYLELKHFCLQYSEWAEIIHGPDDDFRAMAGRNMTLVNETIRDTDSEIGEYLFMAIVQERTYPWLKDVMDIPCGKDMFYDRYRKFFWLLDKKKRY